MSVSSTTLYGIANCDTIRKARRWLEAHAIKYRFHDYRKQGLDGELLQTFESGLGWESLLNRRGSSWRMLDESLRARIDRDSAHVLMLDNPALIKRPILSLGGRLYLGFEPARYAALFS